MSDCHSLFLDYHDEIKIGRTKKDRMVSSKESLRKRIRKWFKDNQPDYEPKFFIQGSHKMKTGVRTKEDICDLDDGIYFFREPDVTATTLQGWVWNAVNGYTDTAPEHRKKCIRSIFVGDYEIDHPIYYKVAGQEYRIAIKNTGFEDSDPKAMVEWFNGKKDKAGKLVRHVMYLKGWCDNCSHKMPSGLAMTILASNAKDKIVLNERDDITLRDILKEIKKALDLEFKCVVPATPNDDLFENYDEPRRNNFLNALDKFIEDADMALKEENQLSASKLWRKHLGSRFPEGKDQKEQTNSRLESAVTAGGLQHQIHGLMNTSFHLFEAEAKLICSLFPEFSLSKTEQDVPVLIGKVTLKDDQQNDIDSYDVKVVCSDDYPFSFPYVYELAGRIPINIDWHVYPDGHCCISSVPEEIILCNKGITLQGFIDNQVMPYFFNQKYREMHGFFLKERSHGKDGNLEFFTDTFKTKDLDKIALMLSFIKDYDEPNRVANCFCNSGLKYRKCHRDAFRLLKPLPLDVIENFISFLK